MKAQHPQFPDASDANFTCWLVAVFTIMPSGEWFSWEWPQAWATIHSNINAAVVNNPKVILILIQTLSYVYNIKLTTTYNPKFDFKLWYDDFYLLTKGAYSPCGFNIKEIMLSNSSNFPFAKFPVVQIFCSGGLPGRDRRVYQI